MRSPLSLVSLRSSFKDFRNLKFDFKTKLFYFDDKVSFGIGQGRDIHVVLQRTVVSTVLNFLSRQAILKYLSQTLSLPLSHFYSIFILLILLKLRKKFFYFWSLLLPTSISFTVHVYIFILVDISLSLCLCSTSLSIFIPLSFSLIILYLHLKVQLNIFLLVETSLCLFFSLPHCQSFFLSLSLFLRILPPLVFFSSLLRLSAQASHLLNKNVCSTLNTRRGIDVINHFSRLDRLDRHIINIDKQFRLIQTRRSSLHFPQWTVAFPQIDRKFSISALTQSTTENPDRCI